MLASVENLRIKRLGLVILAIVVIVILVWVWVHHDKQRAAAEAARRAAGAGITVTTVQARKGDINVYLDAIGTVTPVYTDSITSQVSGPITEVHFKEGQLVQKGDLLIEI